MSRVSTYLNFMGNTEEAFRFYSSVFGTQISGEIARMGDMPSGPGAPPLSDAEKKFVEQRAGMLHEVYAQKKVAGIATVIQLPEQRRLPVHGG